MNTIEQPTESTPPLAPESRPDDRLAMQEATRRLAFTDGRWSKLGKDHLTLQLREKRSMLVGAPNISENAVKQFSTEIAVVYDETPGLSHEDAEGLERLETQLANCGRWEIAQQMQRDLEVVNQALLYFSWSDSGAEGRLDCCAARMDRVFFDPMPGDSRRPGRVYWSRQRHVLKKNGKTSVEWVWDVWDVRPNPSKGNPAAPPLEDGEPERPYFRILDAKLENDLTQQFVKPEQWRGAAFPWRREDSTPVLPFVLYHKQIPADGALRDPWSGAEVIYGTLQGCVDWTNLDHATMRASWDVRGIIGGRLQGTSPATSVKGSEPSPVLTIPDDPTGIKYVRHDGEGAASTFQWGSPVDIEAHERVFHRKSARLAIHYGLSPADVSIETSGPMSGAAFYVSREGKRKASARRVPSLRRGDVESFVVVSAILRDKGVSVPESGYRIEYGTIELSTKERREITEGGLLEVEAGISTRLELRQRLNPGETASESFVALARAEIEQKIESASSTPEGLEILSQLVAGDLDADEARQMLLELDVAPAEPPPASDEEEEEVVENELP